MFVNFEKEIVKNGIKAYKYSSQPESIGRTQENLCFCPESEENGHDCPLNGLVDLTPCVRGPAYLSYPHFYLADKSLLTYVSGLNPRKELHESTMIIEPVSE